MGTDRRAAGSARRVRRVVALMLVGATLVACAGPERVEWPGVRFDLPTGWEVIASEPGRLVVADHLAAESGRGVLVTFLRAPGTLPDDWRTLIAERGATLESDSGVLIAGDVPATQFVLLDVVDGTPVREVLLVVASRELVIAITPRLAPGDTDGPELLLASLDGVREILATVELAPPGLR